MVSALTYIEIESSQGVVQAGEILGDHAPDLIPAIVHIVQLAFGEDVFDYCVGDRLSMGA